MSLRFRIRNGLDLPIAGKPSADISEGLVIRHVALNGQDFIGLKPRLAVEKGQWVRAGEALWTDHRDPNVNYTAPGSGRIVAINRGARRALETVVIELDDKAEAIQFETSTATSDREYLGSLLQRSGLWTAFRTRPFDHVPRSETRPRSIFVTAIDSHPLAADPAAAIGQNTAAFKRGLLALPLLTDGLVYVCTRMEAGFDVPDHPSLRHARFAGPHPSGLPGTHIHLLDPVNAERTVWHISYQDVIAIGLLLESGLVPQQRLIALAGSGVNRPRLVQTRIGASLTDLLDGELKPGQRRRIISGSVLGGRHAGGHSAFLGRYHQQVSVIPEGDQRRFLGWTRFFSPAWSASGTFLKNRPTGPRREFSTARNGRFSGMLPMRVFERLMPLDILPSPLFRAMLVMDTDRAQQLGCLELAEEDLALCTFACPAKTDYCGTLRHNLQHIEKHG